MISIKDDIPYRMKIIERKHAYSSRYNYIGKEQ